VGEQPVDERVERHARAERDTGSLGVDHDVLSETRRIDDDPSRVLRGVAVGPAEPACDYAAAVGIEERRPDGIAGRRLRDDRRP
jgi:hypothetical protein